ncbi:MAG: phosphoribosylanthranilate isomerase [Hyphomicrobium sp.]|jgi:phosphoribosylanthranilate isomerase
MTKVKICGVRTEAQLDAALNAGADLVGLVLFPKSPRNINLATAAALCRRAHERSRAQVVVLLVDPTNSLVDDVVRSVQPDMLQLHGLESPERVSEIRSRAGLPILKAIRVAEAADVANAPLYLAPDELADMILFDAKPPTDPDALPGGNGLSFDWRILDGVKGKFPFALAGGLTPENAREAASLTGAFILDVSSGVESSPGEKDPELIRRFLREAKAAKQT